MPNTQYSSYPAANWSSEISGGSPADSFRPASASQPTAHATATTSTTTTTTSSATAGHQMAAGSMPAATATTNTNTSVAAPAATPARQSLPAIRDEFAGSTGTLDLETHQPIEVVESPTSMNEAFLGSLKSMLLRNRGNFVTATFLIGTQGTTNWEGILHDVGNDYLVIFQPARQRYIACDIYSLKYIEFYDTKQREMCQQILRENGLY